MSRDRTVFPAERRGVRTCELAQSRQEGPSGGGMGRRGRKSSKKKGMGNKVHEYCGICVGVEGELLKERERCGVHVGVER